MNINEKVAIVTGTSKGIGFAVTKKLLENGVRVAGWSRGPTPINHPSFQQMVVNVTIPNEVENAFQFTIEEFGTEIDFLINNAGVGYSGDFEELSHEKWHAMFDVNVHGIYNTTKLVLPLMKKRGSGHIINIGSIAGTVGVKGMAGYAATKHAVTGISHSLFMEVRDYGVKVTCVYPGSIKTEFFENIDGVEGHDNMMNVEDIAETVLHLLQTSSNYHVVDIEVRPLKPKG